MHNFNQIRNNLTIFANRIQELGGNIDPIIIKEPATLSQIESVENELGISLPNELREVFLKHTSGIDYYWDINDIVNENDEFLPDDFIEIFCGELYFDIDLILELEESRKVWIDQVYSNYEDEYDRIYHHKLAFQKVRNGDLIAIDLEPNGCGHIVYLSHDGSENHGRVMANNFYEFLQNYSAIGCVGGEDWQWEIFCEDNGINANGEMATKWREFLGIENK